MNSSAEFLSKNSTAATWQTFYRSAGQEAIITSDARYEVEPLHTHAPFLIALSVTHEKGHMAVHEALSLDLLEEVFAVWADELRRGHFVGKKTLP